MFDNRYPEFKLIIEEVVETEIGDFYVTIEKEKCGQNFRIRAIQQSVKYDGREYLMNSLSIEIPQIYHTDPGALNKDLVVSWKSFLQQNLNQNYYGFRDFKMIYEKFKKDLKFTYKMPLK